MADDITLPGTSSVIDTVDTGAGHRQIVAQAVVTATTDITRPADTTAYAVGDNFANSTSAPTSGGFTLTGVGAASGKGGVITDIIVASSNPAGTPLQGEIWIFDTAVTNINDNAAFAVSDAEIKTLVGVVPFSLITVGNNSYAHVQGLLIGYTPVGSANLRYLVRVAAAYTPISGEVLTVRAKEMQGA